MLNPKQMRRQLLGDRFANNHKEKKKGKNKLVQDEITTPGEEPKIQLKPGKTTNGVPHSNPSEQTHKQEQAAAVEKTSSSKKEDEKKLEKKPAESTELKPSHEIVEDIDDTWM